MKNSSVTKYVRKEYFKYLQSICYASFGPYGSLKGMRKQFYGKTQPIVMCCGYGFCVDNKQFDNI